MLDEINCSDDWGEQIYILQSKECPSDVNNICIIFSLSKYFQVL